MVAFLLLQPKNEISSALHTAAQQTGAGFDYLLRTAMQESSLRPDAKAETSSATGLFQFIESTWLRTMKTDGARFGLGDFANEIEGNGSGRYSVRDPQARADILALRNDPKISALMAGALAEDNSSNLRTTLGRAPSDGELYIAHFLGSRGAGQLIQLAETRPGANAPQSFPDAARANKAIFYHRSGTPRSVGEVYRVLVQKHESADQPARAALNERPAESQPTRFTSLFEGLFRAIVGTAGEAFGQSRSPIHNVGQDFGRSLFTTARSAAVDAAVPDRPVEPLGTQAARASEVRPIAVDAKRAYQRHIEWISNDRSSDDPASWI